mmetsp:Transcript_42620/g.106424  ORF Transcript_42620/g.106424 Transcript_42620/m.106424 type:complete len:299 (-) Transcript_42620:300-1196(-)
MVCAGAAAAAVVLLVLLVAAVVVEGDDGAWEPSGVSGVGALDAGAVHPALAAAAVRVRHRHLVAATQQQQRRLTTLLVRKRVHICSDGADGGSGQLAWCRWRTVLRLSCGLVEVDTAARGRRLHRRKWVASFVDEYNIGAFDCGWEAVAVRAEARDFADLWCALLGQAVDERAVVLLALAALVGLTYLSFVVKWVVVDLFPRVCVWAAAAALAEVPHRITLHQLNRAAFERQVSETLRIGRVKRTASNPECVMAELASSVTVATPVPGLVATAWLRAEPLEVRLTQQRRTRHSSDGKT